MDTAIGQIGKALRSIEDFSPAADWLWTEERKALCFSLPLVPGFIFSTMWRHWLTCTSLRFTVGVGGCHNIMHSATNCKRHHASLWNATVRLLNICVCVSTEHQAFLCSHRNLKSEGTDDISHQPNKQTKMNNSTIITCPLLRGASFSAFLPASLHHSFLLTLPPCVTPAGSGGIWQVLSSVELLHAG